ncbi:hypothetical protein Zmor_018054 [Zophobas morio]|uniref:Ionotropic receptor n=1 Tax=Zophobas morio TaxID=2755281 RepID=A0AA38MDH6_9CUCU|nr:hypothetical protein Zmor_018054 [Zophobas morio]
MKEIYFLALLFATNGDAWISSVENKVDISTIFSSVEDVTFATSSTFGISDDLFRIPNVQIVRNYQNFTKFGTSSGRYCNYVIVDKDFQTFNNTVDNLLNENNLHVHGKYLVLVSDESDIKIDSYFATLWKYEVHNVVTRYKESYYTWYPYENCHQIKPKRTQLHGGFKNKIPNKLNCNLRIDWSVSSLLVKNPFNKSDPGIEVLYLNELSIFLGITPLYLKNNSDLTNRMLKQGFFGYAEIMERENIAVTIGSFGYLPDMDKLGVPVSTYVLPTETFLVLPPRKTHPKWKEFFKFDNLTIALVVAMMVFSGILIFALTRLPIFDAALLSFQLFIQLSIPLKLHKSSSKIFFLSMIMFSMLINFTYVSMLSGVFTQPNYEPEITNMEDFSKTDVPLKCLSVFLDVYLRDLDKATMARLVRKYIPTKERSLEQLSVFLKRQDYAIFVSPFHFHYMKNAERLQKFKVSWYDVVYSKFNYLVFRL